MERAVFAAASADSVIAGYSTSVNEAGNTVVHDVEVFKADTFKDSMGIQRTWTSDHLAQMVFHFDMLRSRGILPNVPHRADHWSGVDNIGGYIIGLRVSDDGTKLLADLEFTDPTRLEKLRNGTYRSRSLEVSMYETNNEEVYYPVVIGLAFVDLPAVEGLHSSGSTPVHCFSSGITITPPKETSVSKFKIANGVETEDPTAVQAYITALEAQAHAAPKVIAFKIAGAETTDPVAVQAHIEQLETAAADGIKAERVAFVKALAEGNAPKIGAPMVEPLTTVALALDAAAFAQFRAGYEAAPALGILAKHGVTDGDKGQVDENGADSALAVATETVAFMRRSGLSDEAISKTAAGIELARLTVAATK
ncbi:MAG: hypothetical protein AB7O86_05795 [Porticoccaceae bacterium]